LEQTQTENIDVLIDIYYYYYY